MTVVAITVERNIFAPEITSSNVGRSIPETQSLGLSIATVTARDRDTQPPHNQYRFRLFATQPTSDYFGLDSLNGNIFVKKDLTLETANTYLVFLIQNFQLLRTLEMFDWGKRKEFAVSVNKNYLKHNLLKNYFFEKKNMKLKLTNKN